MLIRSACPWFGLVLPALRGKLAHAQSWNRRSAQRGQVHPVQRRHPHRTRRRRRIIPSAPSTPTSASSPCRTRGCAQLAEIAKTNVVIPAAIEFVDIAGLVKGASPGRGPGQQVPQPHPRSGRHRPGRALLRGRGHSSTSPGTSIRCATSRSSTPNWCWPTWRPCKKRLEKIAKDVKRGDKHAAAGGAVAGEDRART